MKKLFRNSVGVALLAVTASSLASCGSRDPNQIIFWSSFGTAYTNYLNNITADFAEKSGYDIKHISKGSYDGIKESVSSALATNDYPNIMTGYPDHFASYLGNNVLVQLNPYIERWNAEHPEVAGGLLADYYEDYMYENKELDLYKTEDGTKVPAISALPFNKSTELMGYNGTFVDYCATIKPELANVPTTWQEWKVKGPEYRAIFDTLIKITDDKDATKVIQEGKVLYFDQDNEGKASNFSFTQEERKGKLDFRDVDSKESRIISWDSTDNMFITLVRQWGSEYTSLPQSEKEKDPRRRQGHIRFNAAENKAKTIECLKFFNEMNTDKVFGVPAQFGSSYSSDAFAANKVMFMLCSSGGLSYNTDSWNQRFRVAPLPYYDDGTTQRKFVISQGANIAISNQPVEKYCKDPVLREEIIQKSFNTIVALTRGDYQATWCLNTGYYPCSISATNHEKYQEFLSDTSYDDATVVAYREGSGINQNEYMNAEKGWTKFVDPAFNGSSKIRTQVKSVFEKVFGNVMLDPTTKEPLSTNTDTYENILNYVCNQFASERGVVVDK